MSKFKFIIILHKAIKNLNIRTLLIISYPVGFLYFIFTPLSSYKLSKRKENIDAVILGYTLEKDQKTLRSVSFGSLKNNNKIIFIGSSGNFNSSINQSDLLSQLQKLNIDCDYIKIASNGTAYQFVKPKIVIGVDFYDTQIEKSDQQPIKKPKK